MTWRKIILIAVAALVLRVAHHLTVSPYELVGDEALYWEYARHLDLSYYCKGPGVAWLIAPSVALFGNTEWAVRLPVAVMWVLAGLAVAALAGMLSGGDRKVAALAAVVYLFIPAYYFMGQFMTIDIPYMACWATAALLAWMCFERQRQGRPSAGMWALLGLVLGVGFLFKYSVLLLVPGLAAFLALNYRRLNWNARGWLGMALAAVALILAMSPVIIWNQQRGWPTWHHTLGHMGAPGGDAKREGFDPVRPLEFVASQVGVFGPPAVVLLGIFLVRFMRERRREPAAWPARQFCLCCALPILLTFFAVTFLRHVEANWPLAAYLTLVPLLAQGLALEFRKPVGERARSVVGWWRGLVGLGIFAIAAVSFPRAAEELPLVGHLVPDDRFEGQRTLARKADALAREVAAQSGQNAFIVAGDYAQASLLAFYMEGNPVTYNAQRYLGGRRSEHDYWPDTDLAAPDLQGRPAVLVGGKADRWPGELRFGDIHVISPEPYIAVGEDYQGPAQRTPFPGVE